MVDLFIVRHGESTANATGRIAGVTDVALSEKGERQALALRDYLLEHNYEFDLVFSSPLSRAQNTILPYVQAMGYHIQTDDRLKELNLGPRENKKVSELRNMDYFEDSFYANADGEVESYKQVAQRISEFLQEEVYMQKNKRILVSCHVGVVRGFVAALNGLTREVPRLHVQNASLTHYRIDWNPEFQVSCEKFCYDVYLRKQDLI